jgi:ribosome maturation factor RimP
MTGRLEQEEITKAIRPVVEGLGFDLVAVQVARAGRRGVVRILADRPQGGIQLADCVQISKAASAALESVPGTDLSYTLEVSSPGLDWHCTTLEDFRRYRGQSMTLHLVDGRTVTGTLTEAGGEALALDGKSIPREQVRYGTRNY